MLSSRFLALVVTTRRLRCRLRSEAPISAQQVALTALRGIAARAGGPWVLRLAHALEQPDGDVAMGFARRTLGGPAVLRTAGRTAGAAASIDSTDGLSGPAVSRASAELTAATRPRVRARAPIAATLRLAGFRILVSPSLVESFLRPCIFVRGCRGHVRLASWLRGSLRARREHFAVSPLGLRPHPSGCVELHVPSDVRMWQRLRSLPQE